MLRRFTQKNCILLPSTSSSCFRFCCSATTTINSLLEKLPKGWKQIDFQGPVSITSERLVDEDGVVHRSEEEHRRIFSPYATSSPFAITSEKEKKSKNKKKGQEHQETAITSTEAEAETTHEPDVIYISKSFSFGQFGPFYHWMGRVAAMADQLEVYPDMDWFFMEVTVTVPLTEKGLTLAWYMQDEEALRGANRNVSEGGMAFDSEASMALEKNFKAIDEKEQEKEQQEEKQKEKEKVVWNELALPTELKNKVEQQALGEFCWLIAGDKTQREVFTSEVYLQWYHRADYLVSRKAKEFTEYRNNLTLEQVLQSASQNRKRRRERREEVKAMRDKFESMPDENLPPQYLRFRSRKEREAARNMQMFGMDGRDGSHEIRTTKDVNTDDVKEMSPSRSQFVIDTLPREIRERLEADDDGTAHGFGGGIRQSDPMSFVRTSVANGMTQQSENSSPSSSMHSGGSWH